jgi:DNA-binding NtrC family response regulator
MSSTPPCRVLVADDSVVCREVLVILLKTAGYEVVSVFDGTEALKALRTQTFDLAILDNDMPNLNGLGALTQLRGFLPKLPVVVCSGTVTADDAAHYRRLGIEEVLKKPVDPRVLRDRVAQILARRQAAVPASSLSASAGKTSSADHANACALIAGESTYAAGLQGDVEGLRQFRSVALIEGRHGSGRFELALMAAPPSGGHTFACHADMLEPKLLDRLLNPALAGNLPVLMVILEADQLSPDGQSLLEELVRGRLAPYSALSKRLRLVLCSERTLSDLHFNEFLLLRASATTYEVPDFASRREDWCEIAQTILNRTSQFRGSLTPSAVKWIEGQNWPGDYMQFHRTIEIARLASGKSSTLNESHLVTALAKEHDYAEPLFHDLLFDRYCAA